MTDLTLDQKTEYAERRAREEAAEKHFFDAAQPHFPLGFSVSYRNPGHWDIYAQQCPGKVSAWLHANPGGSTSGRDGADERAFRIRGEPGKVVVFDERWNPHKPHPREDLKFRSVSAAMMWIMEELMQEPVHLGHEVFEAADKARNKALNHEPNDQISALNDGVVAAFRAYGIQVPPRKDELP